MAEHLCTATAREVQPGMWEAYSDEYPLLTGPGSSEPEAVMHLGWQAANVKKAFEDDAGNPVN